MRAERVEDETGFLHALHAHFRCGQNRRDGLQLRFVRARQRDDGLQLFDLLVGEAVAAQFVVHGIEADFIEFVDGHGDVHNLVGGSDDLGDARENLAVVDFDGHAHAEARKHGVDDLNQLHLVQQRVAADDVAVELVELAIAALLRTVGTPNGLILIALEGKLQLLAVHHHVACEGHGEVVAQALLAHFRREVHRIALTQFLVADLRQTVAAVEHLEEQFVALLAVFSHERLQGFHCRRLDLLVAVECINVANRVENIVALRHFHRREVTRTFGDAWFHIQFPNVGFRLQSYA